MAEVEFNLPVGFSESFNAEKMLTGKDLSLVEIFKRPIGGDNFSKIRCFTPPPYYDTEHVDKDAFKIFQEILGEANESES